MTFFIYLFLTLLITKCYTRGAGCVWHQAWSYVVNWRSCGGCSGSCYLQETGALGTLDMSLNVAGGLQHRLHRQSVKHREAESSGRGSGSSYRHFRWQQKEVPLMYKGSSRELQWQLPLNSVASASAFNQWGSGAAFKQCDIISSL